MTWTASPEIIRFSHPRETLIVKIEQWKLSDITPYANNPRHNDDAVDAVDAVAASIREFGFKQPIVVDEVGVIIVGHTRYKAASLPRP
jgi:ParB-like chromosome segregation protein Spo0J